MDTGNKTRKKHRRGYILSEGNQIHALEWGRRDREKIQQKQESVGKVCSDIITCMLV